MTYYPFARWRRSMYAKIVEDIQVQPCYLHRLRVKFRSTSNFFFLDLQGTVVRLVSGDAYMFLRWKFRNKVCLCVSMFTNASRVALNCLWHSLCFVTRGIRIKPNETECGIGYHLLSIVLCYIGRINRYGTDLSITFLRCKDFHLLGIKG